MLGFRIGWRNQIPRQRALMNMYLTPCLRGMRQPFFTSRCLGIKGDVVTQQRLYMIQSSSLTLWAVQAELPFPTSLCISKYCTERRHTFHHPSARTLKIHPFINLWISWDWSWRKLTSVSPIIQPNPRSKTRRRWYLFETGQIECDPLEKFA